MSRPQAKFSCRFYSLKVSASQGRKQTILPIPSRVRPAEDRRHENLLSSRMIHLFSHDIFYFFQNSATQRHKTVDAGNQLADHACTEHINMTRKHRLLQALPSRVLIYIFDIFMSAFLLKVLDRFRSSSKRDFFSVRLLLYDTRHCLGGGRPLFCRQSPALPVVVPFILICEAEIFSTSAIFSRICST